MKSLPLSIIIADDHPLFRNALRATIERELQQPELIEADDFHSLQVAVEQHTQADLILLDLHMPGAEGFSTLVYLNAHFPQLPVMIVSAHDEPEIMRRAIDHGACGFLPKSSTTATMSEAIQQVLQGNVWVPKDLNCQPGASKESIDIADALASLTPQQFRVANMVSQGLLNKQIAFELSVSEATVKAHMTEIFRKLGVHSRTQAALAIEQLSVSSATPLKDFRQ